MPSAGVRDGSVRLAKQSDENMLAYLLNHWLLVLSRISTLPSIAVAVLSPTSPSAAQAVSPGPVDPTSDPHWESSSPIIPRDRSITTPPGWRSLHAIRMASPARDCCLAAPAAMDGGRAE
jgi:hypothetical protein